MEIQTQVLLIQVKVAYIKTSSLFQDLEDHWPHQRFLLTWCLQREVANFCQTLGNLTLEVTIRTCLYLSHFQWFSNVSRNLPINGSWEIKGSLKGTLAVASQAISRKVWSHQSRPEDQIEFQSLCWPNWFWAVRIQIKTQEWEWRKQVPQMAD